MEINGNHYNFGRVVYLTIARNMIDARSPVSLYGSEPDVITIAFDPKRNPQWNTRIDFWVKHTGQTMSANANSAYALANIDIYNIGPALQQFMDAYNAHDDSGSWKETNVKKYSCSLQVGHSGGKRTTIFTGFIGSWNLERKQNDSTVDNIWHLYAQYPGGSEKVVSETDKAVSGVDYSSEAQQELPQTFISGEEYLKAAIMAYPRETYAYVAVDEMPKEESFIATISGSSYAQEQTQTNLVALPASREITTANFDQFFTIKYQHFRTGEEYPQVKEMWQRQEAMTAWKMDYSNLSNALSEIAAKKNCHALIQLDENTGMQTVYIYPAGRPAYNPIRGADFVITDFQNLRRQPGVSGGGLQLDMILEPNAKPGDTFELRISDGFRMKYGNKLSFQPNFDGTMSNATTVFSGANFIGVSNVLSDNEKKTAMSQVGNVFGNKYVGIFVVHEGSTHTADWSTQVDCWGVVLNSGEVKQ